MKPFCLQRSLLCAAAASAIFAAAQAHAFDPRAQRGALPSIEIHLDALDRLAPAAAPVTPAPSTPHFAPRGAQPKKPSASKKRVVHAKPPSAPKAPAPQPAQAVIPQTPENKDFDHISVPEPKVNPKPKPANKPAPAAAAKEAPVVAEPLPPKAMENEPLPPKLPAMPASVDTTPEVRILANKPIPPMPSPPAPVVAEKPVAPALPPEPMPALPPLQKMPQNPQAEKPRPDVVPPPPPLAKFEPAPPVEKPQPPAPAASLPPAVTPPVEKPKPAAAPAPVAQSASEPAPQKQGMLAKMEEQFSEFMGSSPSKPSLAEQPHRAPELNPKPAAQTVPAVAAAPAPTPAPQPLKAPAAAPDMPALAPLPKNDDSTPPALAAPATAAKAQPPVPSLPVMPALPPLDTASPPAKALAPAPQAANDAKAMPPLPALSDLDKAPSVQMPPLDSGKPLPSLTPLTGDEAVKTNAAKTKVAAGDLPPLQPLPTENTATKAPDMPAMPALPPLPALPAAPAAPEPSPAAKPAPKDTVTAPPAAKETQTASLPHPSETPEPEEAPVKGAATANGPHPDMRIAFKETETDVPLSMTAELDAIAQKLIKDPQARVTVMAYAGGPESSGIYPKRVALARGIAVRNYLTTTKGIDIERVNVKALGNKNEGGPADRVDLFILK